MSEYIKNLFNLDKKVAAIIGAGGYLCSEMALALARVNCKVVLLDIDLGNVKKIEKKIQSEGYTDTLSLKIDVIHKKEFILALDKILKKFGHVDILINGAGINSPSNFFDISELEWKKVLDSQITGTFFGCQIFGQYMVNRKSGSIINISSASSGPPLSKAFAYSVSKAGIKNLTQNLARDWGVKGVRVNALRPGFFPTEWNKKNFITPERKKAILNHTPMMRFGEPSELAGAILWLSSEASSFVTGAEITVDGGFSCMTI